MASKVLVSMYRWQAMQNRGDIGEKNMDIMAMNSSSKLADVLKRSGLAASVCDAKRIAGDITSTESKVQSYFDKKKNEMSDELARRSPNRYVKKPESIESKPKQEIVKEEPVVQVQKEKKDIKQELEKVSEEVKQQLEVNQITNPENHTPVQQEDQSAVEKEEEPQTLHKMFEEENSGQEFIYSHIEQENQTVSSMPQQQIQSFTEHKAPENETEVKLNETIETIMKPSETIVEEAKMEVISEEPIEEASASKTENVVKPVQENKLEVISEEPVKPEPQQNTIQKSEEPKIDLSEMFNFGSKTSRSQQVQEPQQVTQEPQVQEKKPDANGITTSADISHPKTGNSESVDIMEMFNFAKRGKL